MSSDSPDEQVSSFSDDVLSIVVKYENDCITIKNKEQELRQKYKEIEQLEKDISSLYSKLPNLETLVKFSSVQEEKNKIQK